MVKIINKKRKYYQCEKCEMYYLDFNFAEKCEEHCKEKKSCDLSIIKHAVEIK